MPTAVATQKIRATSLPLKTMGLATGIVIAVLAAAGFVYGLLRSRAPAVAIPEAARPGAQKSTGPTSKPGAADPPATPLPPPKTPPLPPPTIEDAESDTVIFEPPSTHRPPPVIAETQGAEESSEHT